MCLFDNYVVRISSPPASYYSKIGTAVVFDSSIDKNRDAVDGGGGIDENKLPRNPNNHCAPVFPHSFIRVNTIFEVIKESGGRNAWSTQHLGYGFGKRPIRTGWGGH